MHAFLITGENKESLEKSLKGLLSRLKAKAMEFPLAKIEDVRVLARFANLKLNEATAVVVKNIDEATVPAQNAFLKNLEEPQEKLIFILTARSPRGLLPTIVSRCLVINSSAPAKVDFSEILSFIKKSQGEKLALVDKIRGREEAVAFTEDFIFSCHELLLKTREKHALLAKFLRVASLTLTRLKANGNVSLQLTNMVIGLG